MESLIPNECIICFNPVDTLQPVIFTNCNHSQNYHVECIRSWINKCHSQNQSQSCPICRNEIIIHVHDEILFFNEPSDINICTPLTCVCCCILIIIMLVISIHLNKSS